VEPLYAVLKEEAGRPVLCAPKLGVFASRLATGDRVRPEVVLGHLQILSRRFEVRAPEAAHGLVEALSAEPRRPVGYGEPLFALTAGQAEDPVASVPAAAAEGEAGRVAVRAPIHGIFYRRPSPGAPPFVELGETVRTGQTVGLIEVMKTFNPVIYGGPGLPAEAKVMAAPTSERQEVEAGAVLFWVG
jgi:biotin carboxyl carrier protein